MHCKSFYLYFHVIFIFVFVLSCQNTKEKTQKEQESMQLPIKAMPPAEKMRMLASFSDPDAQSPAIPNDLHELLTALANPAGIPRETLYTAIRAYGKKALPALFQVLAEGTHELRLAVVRLLGEMKEYAQDIIPQLVARLENETVIQVRSMVVDSIVRLGQYNETVKNALLRALNDAAWLVRWEAVRGIGNLGEKARELIPHLESRLTDANNWVQLYAVISIFKLAPMTDAIVNKAQKHLETLTLDPDLRFRLNILGQIEHLPESTCPYTAFALARMLEDPEISVKRAAAKLFATCAPHVRRGDYEEILKKAALDADYSVRTHASKALEQLP